MPNDLLQRDFSSDGGTTISLSKYLLIEIAVPKENLL